ncbi:MAG: ABC transporter ATP-binding protein [Candidatus Paceibacterota bacterium]
MSAEPIITIKDVNLWYEKGKPAEVQALKNITLNIEKGDYVSFFGPSGCGKTTMLYAIAGIDQYQSGDVFVNGKKMTGLSKKDLAIFRQNGIGIVFQQFNLLPSLTVLQNVALPMSFLGLSSDEAEKNAKKLLERLALLPYANRHPFELSGGQQQRVGIARALANDPPIIIADEPLGNLDSVNAQNVLAFLKELNEKDGRTIIMVTHEAWSLRDVKTIFYMKDGTVTETEKPSGKSIADSLKDHLNEQLGGVNGSSASSVEMTARVLSNFLLRGYTLDEVSRFEVLLNDRLSGKTTAKEFLASIHSPLASGGIGLWNQKAKRIAHYVDKVMETKKEIHEVLHHLEENPEIAIHDEVCRVRNWLLQSDEAADLSHDQIQSLDQVVSDRMRGYLTAEQFVEILDLPLSKWGAGLSTHHAKVLSEKLESFLSNDYELPETKHTHS